LPKILPIEERKSAWTDVLTTLQPGQLLVLVKDELTELMVMLLELIFGDTISYFDVGLQGSGKTTFLEN
jgi:signal recognition particle GTPase